jgi:hypothetical protein
VRVEAKLLNDGMLISNPSPRKGENPSFFFLDFETIPRAGEMVILHDAPGGNYVVTDVVHEVMKGRSHPLLVLELLKDQTRQSVLQNHGWLPGDEAKSSAFEIARIALEN